MMQRNSRHCCLYYSCFLCLLLSCLRPAVVRMVQASTDTETLIGIVGRDFIMLGADAVLSQSIALTATNIDKIHILVDPFPQRQGSNQNNLPQKQQQEQQQTIVAAVVGDPADADWLVQQLRAQAVTEEYSNGFGCDVEIVYHHRYDDDGDEDVRIALPGSVGVGMSTKAMAHLTRQIIYGKLRTPRPLGVQVLIAGMMPQEKQQQQQYLSASARTSSSLSSRIREQVKIATSFVATQNSNNRQKDNDDDDDDAETASSASSFHLLLVPHLFWLDEYGSLQRMKEYAVHGRYAGHFIWSILDRHYRPDLSRQEACKLLQLCFQQLRQRYVFNVHGGAASLPCIKCISSSGCQQLQ